MYMRLPGRTPEEVFFRLCGRSTRMPEISRFYGMVIKMYFADHAPPHFHAEYAEHKA